MFMFDQERGSHCVLKFIPEVFLHQTHPISCSRNFLNVVGHIQAGKGLYLNIYIDFGLTVVQNINWKRLTQIKAVLGLDSHFTRISKTIDNLDWVYPLTEPAKAAVIEARQQPYRTIFGQAQKQPISLNLFFLQDRK